MVTSLRQLADRRVFAGCLLFLTFFAFPAYAACDAAQLAQTVANRSADCPAGLDQIELVFTQVISVVVGLGFIAMLVMIIAAGIKYLTSAGEPKAVQAAHQALTWALLGVVFMAIAWFILQLIHAFTGINVTIFDIKTLCGGSKFCPP